MADALKLGIVVEGVETLEAANHLRGLGVHHMQGFFFSDAVPGGICEMLMQRPFSGFGDDFFAAEK